MISAAARVRTWAWIVLLVGTASHAAVLRVPSEYPTIQAGVDAAVVGDSVLVAPGVYTDITRRNPVSVLRDACLFLKGGVTVLSEGGPAVTTIDMRQLPGLLFPHVVFGYALGLPETVLEGFTIAGVPFGRSTVFVFGGGKLVIRRCVVRDGDAGPTSVGGLDIGGTELDLLDSVIERCRGDGAGGLWHGGADLYVARCRFEDCEGTALQAFDELPNSFRAVIEDCTFVRNRDLDGNGGGLAVSQYGGGCEVRRCLFLENESRQSGGGATIGNGGPVVVEDCVFWRNRSTASAAGALYASPGSVRRCTFVENSAAPYVWANAVTLGLGPSEFVGNILAGSTGGFALGSTGPVIAGGCNVFWNNAAGDAQNYVFAPTDRILDPLFCDEAAGDLTLEPLSPCLPDFSGGCGRIGALEQGCGTVSIEAESWGKVKAAYREPLGGER